MAWTCRRIMVKYACLVYDAWARWLIAASGRRAARAIGPAMAKINTMTDLTEIEGDPTAHAYVDLPQEDEDFKFKAWTRASGVSIKTQDTALVIAQHGDCHLLADRKRVCSAPQPWPG